MKTFATKPLLEMHRKDVLEIYKLGIETKNATFNTSVPTWDEWDKGHLQHSRFYVEIDKRIAGWIALSPVSSRCNYSGVAEVSIYIHPDFFGLGIASELMKVLICLSLNHL